MNGKVILDLKDYEELKRYKDLSFAYIKVFADILRTIDASEVEIRETVEEIIDEWI